MNQKLQAARLIARLDLPSPPAFVVARAGLKTLDRQLRRYPKVNVWYLRADRSDANALRVNAVSKADLAKTLSDVFEVAEDARILVQQRVDAKLAGVAANTDCGVFVEYVQGALKSLLRDGVTPSRLLLGSSGEVLAQHRAVQEFWYQWEADTLVRKSRTLIPPLRRQEQLALLRGTSKLQRPAVYEWVQDRDGAIFFIDVKPMPPRFLGDRDTLIAGIERGTPESWPASSPGKITKPKPEDRMSTVRLNRPLHKNLDLVLQNATRVICRAGALLSHLLVYASQRGIPCIISPKQYRCHKDL